MSSKGKLVIAFLYTLANLAIPFIDGRTSPDRHQWVAIAISAVTAFSVYLMPLVSGYAWTKSAIGATLAGLNALVVVIDGPINGTAVITILVAVAGALGIFLAPAASPGTGVKVTAGSDKEYALAA